MDCPGDGNCGLSCRKHFIANSEKCQVFAILSVAVNLIYSEVSLLCTSGNLCFSCLMLKKLDEWGWNGSANGPAL